MTHSAEGSAREHLFLVGFMGSGKSTVGKELSRLLHRPFRDLDGEIESAAGKAIPQIFADSGEATFRRLEREALQRLTGAQSAVVATGGGLVIAEENRRTIARLGRSVWLRIPFDLLVQRLSEEERARRPLFADQEQARQLLEERTDAYSEADWVVDIEPGDSPHNVAESIVRWMRGEMCGI